MKSKRISLDDLKIRPAKSPAKKEAKKSFTCSYEKWEDCCEDCKALGGVRLVSDGRFLSGVVCDCRGVCPGCRNTGFVDSVRKGGYEVKQACIRKHLTSVCSRISSAEVPSSYHNARWAWYQKRVGMKERLAGMGAWVSGGMTGGAWLQGNTGTGKSCMTALMVVEAIKRGKSAWWVSMPDLLAKQRRSFDLKMPETPMERALKVDFLVLDDVDKVKVGSDGMFTPWVDEQVWQLFKERCENGLSMAVTTNTIASKWCARSTNEGPLASRIKGFFTLYAVSGSDAREQQTLSI